MVFLPFLLIGEGDRSISLGSELDHLATPGCWIALLPCSFAERTLYEPKTESAASQHASAPSSVPEQEPFLPAPTTFTVRHAWFTVWLLWFVVYLVRRDRQRGGA